MAVSLSALNANVEQSVKSFNKQIEDTIQQIDSDVKNFTIDVAIKLYEKIVERTPIDTGLARANWTISFGESNLAIISPSWVTKKTLPGSSVAKKDMRARMRFGSSQKVESAGKFAGIKNPAQIAHTREVIKKFKSESKGRRTITDIYISNGLHYITYLENGRVQGPPWGSLQAPNGMVAVTLQDLTRYMDLFAKKYKTLR